jgi:hypothetical protein
MLYGLWAVWCPYASLFPLFRVSVVPAVRFIFLVVGVVRCRVVGLLLWVLSCLLVCACCPSLPLCPLVAVLVDDWLLYVCCCGPWYQYRWMEACVRVQGECVCGFVGVMFVGYDTAFCGVYFTRWGLGSRTDFLFGAPPATWRSPFSNKQAPDLSQGKYK